MNPARIGNTVHYVPHLSGPAPKCLAAMVISVSDDGDEINASVWAPAGGTYVAYPIYDFDGAHVDSDGNTTPSFGGFTPGTWHHIH